MPWHPSAIDGKRSVQYPEADQLLVLADCGGNNGYRTRLWKHHLQVAFADRFSLCVKVCHYPLGSSKWNPIEHRMFSFISNNWAAQPLTDYKAVLKFIRTTKIATVLRIRAVLYAWQYERGIRICDQQRKQINLKYYTQPPKCNFSISPIKKVN